MPRRIAVLAAVAVVTASCSGGRPATTAPTTIAASTTTTAPTTTTRPATTTTTTSSTSTTTTTTAVDPVDRFVGAWLGELVPGAQVQVRFERTGAGTLEGVFDSLSEGITDLPLEVVVVAEDRVEATLPIGPATLTLTVSENGAALAGSLVQFGETYPLRLQRIEEAVTLQRPQTPQPPFPYEERLVTFRNDEAGIDLAGTLTIPHGDGPFPGAVLVSGSGDQNRDEELLGHRPFLVIADHLTRNGVAVLRYDDRGVGESQGDPSAATTFDLAGDAAAAVRYLAGVAEIDPDLIGIVGHSEGGVIGPIVADDHGGVGWLVLLAGPGVDGASVVIAQTRRGLEAQGEDPEQIEWWASMVTDLVAVALTDVDDEAARGRMRLVLSEGLRDAPGGVAEELPLEVYLAIADQFSSPWMRAFLAYDPAGTLSRLDVPVLALLAGLDVQVLADQNEQPLREALGASASPDWEVRVFPGLNHLFQHATTGAVGEYAVIEQTIDPVVLDVIAGWILSRTG